MAGGRGQGQTLSALVTLPSFAVTALQSPGHRTSVQTLDQVSLDNKLLRRVWILDHGRIAVSHKD